MPSTVITPNPRILVTGGTGFVGRAIAARLRCEFGDATVSSPGRSGNGGLDMLDPAAVRHRLRDDTWTHIVHACGCHGRKPESELFLLHATATQNLLESIRPGAPPTWINIGSASQYGAQDPAAEPLLTEDHAPAPVSPYGASKVAQENLVRAAADQGRIAAVFLRVFNAIGPGQTGPCAMTFLIGELNAARTSGLSRIRLDRWDAVRDYIDVRDVADAVASVVRSERAVGQRLNVCSGEATPLIELAQRFAAAARVPVAWEPGSSVRDIPEIPWQRGCRAKMLDLCGWQPRIPLDKTLADTWAAAR